MGHVIRIVSQILSSRLIQNLAADQALFIEPIAQSFRHFVRVPFQLLIHIVGRQKIMFIGKSRIRFYEILRRRFWMQGI